MKKEIGFRSCIQIELAFLPCDVQILSWVMAELIKKWKVLFILPFAMMAIAIQAQSEIDSLKNLLKQNLEDSARIEVLNATAWKLLYEDKATFSNKFPSTTLPNLSMIWLSLS